MRIEPRKAGMFLVLIILSLFPVTRLWAVPEALASPLSPSIDGKNEGVYELSFIMGALALILFLMIVILWRLWVASDRGPRISKPGGNEATSVYPPAVNVQLRVGCSTHVGRERAVNEDNLLVLDLTESFPETDRSVMLFAVADGMGGHAAGDVASQLVVDTVANLTDEILIEGGASVLLSDAQEGIFHLVQAANQAVYRHRKANASDMGTTLVMALFIDNHVTIGNAGDSRAYRLHRKGIVQVTTDHSLVERLVATDQITAEEARHHPQKNVIYRVVGDSRSLNFEPFELQLNNGEALLLCSDGLSNMVRDEEIWRIWKRSPAPQEACDRLIEAANRAGGEDNVTVIIVQLST